MKPAPAAVSDKPLANYRPLLVWGLATAAAVDFFHRQIMAITMGPLGEDLLLSDTERGLLISVYALAYALSSLILPRFMTSCNRRWLLSGAVAVAGMLAVLSGLMESYAAILVCRAGIGMAVAVMPPATQLVIADNIAWQNAAKVQGIVAAGAPVGVILALGLWGWITASFGWQTGLLCSGVVTVAVAVLLFLFIGEQPRSRVLHADARLSFLVALRRLWQIKSYRHMLLGFSLSGVAAMGAMQWLPIFLMRYHALDIKTIGLLLAGIVGVIGMCSALLSGALGARLTPRDGRAPMWICMGGMMLATPVFMAAYFVSSTTVAVLLLSVGTLLGFMAPPQFFMVAQVVVALPLRAFSAGVAMALFTALGLGGGVSLAGAISETGWWGVDSLRYALAIVTVFYVWAAVHFLLAARNYLPEVAASDKALHAGLSTT